MQLEQLRGLIADGKFHHATYRSHGTCWEGLWIYVKDESGFRGFRDQLCFGKGDPDLKAAEALVGAVYVGAYGG